MKFAKITEFKDHQVLVFKDYREREEEEGYDYTIKFQTILDEVIIVKGIGFPTEEPAEEFFDMIDDRFAEIYFKGAKKLLKDAEPANLANLIIKEYKKRQRKN